MNNNVIKAFLHLLEMYLNYSTCAIVYMLCIEYIIVEQPGTFSLVGIIPTCFCELQSASKD